MTKKPTKNRRLPRPIESAGLRGAVKEVLQSKEWKRLQKLLDEVSWGYQ